MSVNDPNFTLANAINKGYAYLACNRDLFSWQILECFELALKLDPEQKHSAIINCGVKQVLENEKACYHLMKGNESIKITLTPS
jgi:hypothetical protein